MPESRATQTPRVAIIGGGVAGLATALHLRDLAQTAHRPLSVTVFEKDTIPGGNLRTLRQDGWQLEWGPNGFLDNEPATLRLVERLKLQQDLQKSSDAARRRFLVLGGRLQEIPTKPGPFLKSPLLSARAKWRLAAELFIPRRKGLGLAADDPTQDETIAQFGTRRLGSEFTETMLDPMVKGIFGGNPHTLSLAAAFPRMVELEQKYGSLFKAMFSLARKRKKLANGGPSGELHSFDGGMETLIQGLVDALTSDPLADIQTGQTVISTGRTRSGWQVTTDGETFGPFDVVINAAPAHAAAGQLAEQSPTLSELLANISYAPMAVIALGYHRADVAHDLDGFGMLIPGREKREVLGALWTSSIFKGRAPDGMVLFRGMVGGSDNPHALDLSDEELKTITLAELRPLLGLNGAPAMCRIIRHEKAIAQYEPGHPARLKAMDEALERCPGLYLTGSSYRGISVNACIKEAEIVAETVLSKLETWVGLADAEATS